jgi:nucleoside-diphosphate-sugar epimerase
VPDHCSTRLGSTHLLIPEDTPAIPFHSTVYTVMGGMSHVLLTGARGRVGSHTLNYLLARNLRVTSLDILPLSQTSLSTKHIHHTLDLTDYKAFEDILTTSPTKIDGVIHLGAIPDPLKHDARIVHNVNVTSSYNVLKTASDYGVRRIVQASSVNAHGLGYSPEGHHKWDELPHTEEVECRPVS